jgi:hypothetical protein
LKCLCTVRVSDAANQQRARRIAASSGRRMIATGYCIQIATPPSKTRSVSV